MIIRNVQTVWLYAFSPRLGEERKAYFTVFAAKKEGGPQTVMATTALSYLTSLDGAGAGTLIKDVTTVSGGLEVFTDFVINSVLRVDTISLSWGLSANGAEAYAQGNLFYLSFGTSEDAAGDVAGEGAGNVIAPGAGQRIEPEAALAIYRRDDGAVLAIHGFATGAGSQLPDAETLHAAALANAVSDKLGDEGTLALLPVDPQRLERGVAYRVRAETGELEVAARAG